MRVPPNEGGATPFVLPCEHASNHVPAAYAGLGLPPRDLGRHIARDIGAAALARGMSRRLDAPPFLSGYSRLLIDCNRPPGAPTSIRARSGGTTSPATSGWTPAKGRGMRRPGSVISISSTPSFRLQGC